jgi:predicted nuclease of predicted toxin-antitoxin system
VKIRYQADADLNEDIVTGVRRRAAEIDFQTAQEARLENLQDPEVLTLAAQSGRILVTHDRRTMPAHFGTFIETRQSPGLFIISQRADVLLIIEELILIWTASEAEEYVNSLRTLPL